MSDNARRKMPALDPSERIKNFCEVALGYSSTLAFEEASRCLHCKNAPCMSGCPVGVRIPDFISAIKQNDLASAATILRFDNNLPAICGRVCPQENQCEKYCVRREKAGGSVSIGALERYVADNAPGDVVSPHAKIGLKVAVVGSGPAGLSCAADLARAGAEVTVFEALHTAGGVLSYGIPEFRLPKDIVRREIAAVRSLGVQFVFNAVIGKSLYVDELLSAYDAVFIGSGAGLPSFLGIEGENLAGVYSANEYLTRVNLMGAYRDDSVTPIMRGKRVIVVGAGNVAMDSARTARRLGAEVTLVYRRSRAEMPARREEISHAEEEGVKFELLATPTRILGDADGFVKSAQLVRMRLGEPDQSGRRSPIPVDGSEFEIPADEVIVALGTTPNPLIKNSFPQLSVGKRGTIIVDECGRTNIKGVYAGGDATTGAATVILAMGAGKRAAKTILEDMKGRTSK